MKRAAFQQTVFLLETQYDWNDASKSGLMSSAPLALTNFGNYVRLTR